MAHYKTKVTKFEFRKLSYRYRGLVRNFFVRH